MVSFFFSVKSVLSFILSAFLPENVYILSSKLKDIVTEYKILYRLFLDSLHMFSCFFISFELSLMMTVVIIIIVSLHMCVNFLHILLILFSLALIFSSLTVFVILFVFNFLSSGHLVN